MLQAASKRNQCPECPTRSSLFRRLCSRSYVRALMHRTLITAIGLFLVSAQLKAAESPQFLADQFVTLLRYEEQYFKYREQCIATQRTVSPGALVAKNPDYFGGIRPGHKNWQVLVAGYENYFQEACSRPSKSEFLSALSASYAKALSTQQLKAAIAFYSSPTGLALISAHRTATAAVYETWTSINGKHLTEATARFQGEVVRLVQSK